MKLLELFDKTPQVTWDFVQDSGAHASFVIGGIPYQVEIRDGLIFQNGFSGPPESKAMLTTWEVEFAATLGRRSVITNTNTGNQFEVYASVFATVREFFKIQEVRPISVGADDDGRYRLYLRFMNKFLPGWKVVQGTLNKQRIIAFPPGHPGFVEDEPKAPQ